MKILLISDIHGNIEPFNEIVKNENFDEVLFLGDAVDYGPKPAEVIDKLKELGAKSVLGNHDNALIYNIDCMCGEATHWISVYFRENYTKKMVNRSQIDYLKNFKIKLEIDIDGFGKGLLTHGSPSNPLYGYLYPWLSDDNITKMLYKELRLKSDENKTPKLAYDIYLIGHTHYQFMKKINNSIIINPGSAGEPRDNDYRAAYAIIDTETKNIILKRIKYNVDKVIRNLEDLKIPNPYLTHLKYMFINGSVLMKK
ncbi:putative phosphoesterase [Caldisphaera lagunensis DSM 15908]|uniref:Putative phosphoesterase n=1 Tax=Caldisphaera lagunensis (strain DSM 15908 / JCM 11604 / ANMR 0165 / IC-154) TaxID=1056495 RepID=L0A9H3_CALLD|nr:metallophosphoesterase family protein [Caldisphaera lagunensis]AFZ70069.1 putative phosphoesterase [Caldisphaera lagunensis DSM 15908]